MAGRRSKRYHAYRKEVWRLTDEHHPRRAGWTRQHHVPISRCFSLGIEAELAGSEENVDYWKLEPNIALGTRLDGTGLALLEKWRG